MHFVLLNQFYPPDVLPTGVVLEAVAEELARRGHQVTVISGQSPVVSKQTLGDDETALRSKGGWKRESRGAHAPPRVTPGAPPGASAMVQVVRLWSPGWGKRKSALGKVLSYASYYAGVGWWLLRRKERADRIVALTSPPYLSLLARAGSRWHGGYHAHWVMDLYPDVLLAHGMLREGSVGHRVLGALARWGMGGKRCHQVITLGPDMAERLGQYLPEGRTAGWVPLWGTAGEAPAASDVKALRARRGWGAEATVFLYSGNMGLGHRFSEVLAAMPRLIAAYPGHDIRLAYFGGGKRKGEIKAALAALTVSPGSRSPAGISCPQAFSTRAPHQSPGTKNEKPSTSNKEPSTRNEESGTRNEEPDCQLKTVSVPPVSVPPVSGLRSQSTVSGYVPHEELAAHLASGDVHLASLDPAWDGMMLPSKLQGIFAAGRPVLFTGSRTCSMGRWILESGGGWVCEPDNVDAHVQAMREALDPAERRKRGAAAQAFAAVWFDRGTNVRKMVDGLEKT